MALTATVNRIGKFCRCGFAGEVSVLLDPLCRACVPAYFTAYRNRNESIDAILKKAIDKGPLSSASERYCGCTYEPAPPFYPDDPETWNTAVHSGYCEKHYGEVEKSPAPLVVPDVVPYPHAKVAARYNFLLRGE